MEQIANDVVQRIAASQVPYAVLALAEVVPIGIDRTAVREALAADSRVARLFTDLEEWPPARPSTRAYDPKDAIWKVGVLADLGLDRSDERVAALAERLLAAHAPDGTFIHGGFDHTRTYDARGYTCITHLVTGALARFG